MSEPAPRSAFDALYAQYQALPDGTKAEIAEGEIRVMPRPRPRHVRAASVLGARLMRRFGWDSDDGPGGWVILDEPELRFGDEVRAPDLAGWRLERYAEPEDNPITPVPDWTCEVLSPNTARTDPRGEGAAVREARRRLSLDRRSGHADTRSVSPRRRTVDRRVEPWRE